MIFEQIRGVTIGSSGAADGGFSTIIRTMDAYSPPTMVSEASRRQAMSYYFSEYLGFGGALQSNMPESCKDWDGGRLDLKMCSGIAAVPATGVVISESADDCKQVADAFSSEVAFGTAFSWRDAAEQKAMEASEGANLSPSADDARMRAELQAFTSQ